jgi:hypothetical protein
MLMDARRSFPFPPVAASQVCGGVLFVMFGVHSLLTAE